MPSSATSVIAGVDGACCVTLLGGKIHLELGASGMERMIAYPILLWGAGFGGYLIAYPEERRTEQKQ